MRIGVMLLENTHLRGLGTMSNAESYETDVSFELLSGVMGRDVIYRPEAVRNRIIAAAMKLTAAGAKVITMNCGFGIRFQRDLIGATNAVCVTSSLLLLPTLAVIHGEKVGVLTFDERALDLAHFEDAGWSAGVVPPVAGVRQFDEWRLLDAESVTDLPLESMGSILSITACRLVADFRLEALVLECTGMFPFARQLREKTGCAVYTIFDLLRLVNDH